MPPQPLEGIQGPTSGYIPAGQEVGPRTSSISLGMLIDFIIQRTYHDLTVLAELLPRKTDMERKIEIYNFSARTRQLFIRLLALVKWANSASKVDKSAHIMSFLDKQSMLFVETADMLARMARETLVRARLPNFHIPAAVEILTTGTYSRLPACIKERIIPPDPITFAEKKLTLLRLNQVIQHRLVTGSLLPQMRRFKIHNGRVTFLVQHEFEVSLTVMGDGPNIPWRLLNIEILVEDKESGDIKPLTHPLQVNYIHQLLQARLIDNQNALTEVYNFLHYFCQSLQLEVLYTQTLRLISDRLDESIHVDEYVPGVKLTVSYWRELTTKDPKSELGYRLTIQSDINEITRPLAVIHIPSIGAKESTEVADRAIRSEHLSMERLIIHTVYIRSLSRLNDLKLEFKTFLKDVDYHLQGTPAKLTVPVLTPCLRAEQIHITVDTHTGMFRCHVPKHLDCPIIQDLQAALNSDHRKLPQLVSELRFWITHKRCKKTLQHLPAVVLENMQFINFPTNSLLLTCAYKVFVKLHRHPNYILVIGLKEKEKCSSEIEYEFYVGNISYCTSENNEEENTSTDIPQMYMKFKSLNKLDTFLVTHGPGTDVVDSGSLKRKSSLQENGPPAKQQKTIYPAYFIPELAHVVALSDEQIPFCLIAKELTKRNISHGGIQVESNATSLVLKLHTLPQPGTYGATEQSTKICSAPPKIEKVVWDDLLNRLLSVSIRSQMNKSHQNRTWLVEFVFHSTPLPSNHPKEQGNRRTVYLTYELSTSNFVKTVDDLLKDWEKIVYLYTLVYDFSLLHKNEKSNLYNTVTIKSYNYTNLLLGYGLHKEVTCSIFWSSQTKNFNMVFVGGVSAINAHSVIREQLQFHLNKQHNLVDIIKILHDTYQPLSSIAKLPIIPQLGIPRPQVPVLSFCILPQSATSVRISYQSVYCLEIRFRAGGLVSIRDGAYSRFDRSNVVEEFTPTQGLKGFLSKYVDENAVYRRKSQSEDDNPPSPMVMDDPHGHGAGGSSPFLGSGTRGPQSPRDCGLRFAPPVTPPIGSNPHTPASPHPIGQSHSNFNMTSPPGPHIPHPSPGGLMPSSPLNPQPSPMAHSPGPNLYMQSHTEGSPFAVLSPAASNWPGSPSMSRPSPRTGQSPEHKTQIPNTISHLPRVLPARSWAGAVPTLITHEALETLCRSCPNPNKDIVGPDMSPLERFLGCVYMRRHLQRYIQSEECITPLNSNEPGVVLFKSDGIQYKIFLNQAHMQSLHLKATHLISMAPSPDGKQPFQWSAEDLQILEQFFDTRAAAPPYRPNALNGFCRALTVMPQALKDFIQIMRLELMPDLAQGMKWNIQFCLRVPPSAAPIVPIGNPAVVICRSKILFFIQITRIPYPGMDWKDSPTLVLPMIYDTSTNITQLAERREQAPSVATNAVSAQLRRFVEYHVQHGECTLFPAVRDLLMNLILPNDPPPPPTIGNQIVSSPANPVGLSPGPVMHSPMPTINQVGSSQQNYTMGSNQI